MAERRGKLIRKEDLQEKSYLEVQEYPWREFKESGVMFPDNARKNIVRASSHLQEELAEKIKKPLDFEKPFNTKSKTLMPADLNADYARTQHEMMMRKRKRLLDEEELFNLEMADMGGSAPSLSSGWSKRHQKVEAETVKQAEEPEAKETNASLASVAAAAMEVASAAHESIGTQAPLEELQQERTKNETLGQKLGFDQGYAVGMEQGLNEGAAKGNGQGFTQGHESGYAEGLSQGFEIGLREGETKGTLVASQKSEKFAELTTKTLVELDHLRSHLLLAGQDIFVEIAQLATEKLLRTKLGISETVLKNLLTSAVEMYRESHKLCLEVSEADAPKVKALIATLEQSRDEGKSRLQVKVNADLEMGDFRVESDAEIVTHDLKKSISELIEGLRSEIFEDSKATKLKKSS
jgi:flagellar biosynthesis/type III secretory pathway protein FliH